VTAGELEALVGFRPNAALIDCEGCIGSIFPNKENDTFLRQLDLILMEEDQFDSVDYAAWHEIFVKVGLRQIWHSHDTHAPSGEGWSWAMRHRAWIKPSAYVNHPNDWIDCDTFAIQRGIPKKLLQCVGQYYPGNPAFKPP